MRRELGKKVAVSLGFLQYPDVPSVGLLGVGETRAKQCLRVAEDTVASKRLVDDETLINRESPDVGLPLARYGLDHLSDHTSAAAQCA
jgi:hypothetical protein